MKEKTRLIAVRGDEILVLQKVGVEIKYTLAGGVKKKKETHIEALMRETKEEIEVSLKPEKLIYLCSSYIKKSNEIDDVTKHYFVCEDEIKGVKNREPEKFKKVHWVNWEKVLNHLDKSDKNAVQMYFKTKNKE